jgi:hypothetical protein
MRFTQPRNICTAAVETLAKIMVKNVDVISMGQPTPSCHDGETTTDANAKGIK